MSIEDIQKKIIDIMVQVGMGIDEKNDIKDGDLQINDYVSDSFQFISFIMELEGSFDIELPDQYVQIDSFNSLKAVSLSIYEILKDKA